MALAAAQVIDALATRLAAVVATGGRAYTSRAWPLHEDGLPAWRVVAADELVERVSVDGVHLHTLSAEATAYARATADLDDTLHALASAGLQAVFAAVPPFDARLAGIDRRVETLGEAAVGAITLRIDTTYYTNPATPETIISS